MPLLLSPIVYCQPDLGFGGPGMSRLSICGQPLFSGSMADLRLDSAPPGSLAFIGWGLALGPTPFRGGTAVLAPLAGGAFISTDANSDAIVPGIPGGGRPLVIYVQAVVADPLQPSGLQFTNAVAAHFFP